MKTLIPLLCCAACAANDNDPPMPLPDAPTQTADPPAPDAPPATCTPDDPNSCSGDTICIGSKCEQAFDRIYRLSRITVAVAPLDPNGSAWDPLGGAPDPFVELRLDDASILTTASASNVFQSLFTETVDAEIVAGLKLQVIAGDADVNAADPILDCTFDPLTADTLRHRIVSCVGSGAMTGSSVYVHVDAKN